MLFLLFFLFGLSLLGGGWLVALVETIDHVLGDVETLVGHQDVVACLREDQVEVLVSIVVLQEVLQ